ncbi:MAG: ArsR family transcriptional regulator [Anaerolineae bacterium]|nr:ArsR family transcriptional regulator [Anaerolineae bacterium]
MISDDSLLNVFKALADQNRLRLYQLLLRSDQTNSELMVHTQLSQNLLSHHLTVLVDAGLVEMNRSIGDARRYYYRPRWDLPAVMSAWWQQHSPLNKQPFPALQQPKRVLFLCLKNSVRSLVAEALARHLAPTALIPFSAGIEPGNGLPDVMVRVLTDYGVPVHMLHVKTYAEMSEDMLTDGGLPDLLITVCDVVHETAVPRELAGIEIIHWSLVDPLNAGDTDAEQVAATRQLYHDIEQRLAVFVAQLAHAES